MIIPNGPLNPPRAAMTLAPGRPRRLVFAGEAIVDVLMRVPGLPPRGGDLLATSSQVTVGGGFNVMAAAARQSLPVLYAGGHGTGPWGDLVRAALTAEGIGLLRPPDPSRDTGFDVALVEPDAERTFVTSLGAESASEAGSWDAVPAGPGDAVYASGYGLVPPGSGPELGAWAAALPPAVLLFFDPGPLAAQIPREVLDPVLARCDWLSCNAREAALLSDAADPEEAARCLLDRTARAGVIVRVGPDGCFLATRPAAADAAPAPDATRPRDRDAPAASARIPAPVVHAVDTTGAGDAHSGVFLAALADGLSPEDAARRANAAAALAVTRPGPATSPARAELDAWVAGLRSRLSRSDPGSTRTPPGRGPRITASQRAGHAAACQPASASPIGVDGGAARNGQISSEIARQFAVAFISPRIAKSPRLIRCRIT
jgi:sugar/nucleoside kinase (ribokinase family)